MMLLPLLSFLCITTLEPAPSLVVFPFDVQAPLPPETGLGLLLALEDQALTRNSLVTISSLESALEKFGLKLGTPIPFAKKRQIAAALGVEMMVWGRLTSDQIVIETFDFAQNALLPTQTLALSPVDAAFTQTVLLQLGFSIPDSGPAGIDYYTQMAATYLVQDQAFVQKMLLQLVQVQPKSELAFQQYSKKCLLPEVDACDQEALAFWRDLLLQHAVYYSAFAYSDRLLELRFSAEDYAAHAQILYALGKEESACSYAKMAMAYGADQAALGPSARSCGLEWIGTLQEQGSHSSK